MKATLSLSIPLLLVSAGNYVAFAEQVATTILLDVNPSIEITVNKIDEVIEVKALNEDAETVIEDMDLEGVDVDVAMDVLIGIMVQRGYIDETKNAVLITVDNEDKSKQRELEFLVTSEINDTLAVADITPVIFAQNTERNGTKVKTFAKEHDISLNKAAFIQKILKENKELSEEELVAMNVESLSEVIRAKNIDLHDSVAYSDKTLTKTSKETVKKAAKAADKQTASSGRETEKQAEKSPATEPQGKAAEKPEVANTQLTGQPVATAIAPPEAQSHAIEQQAAANSNAVEKQAEAQIQAAEKQAEAAAKAAEQQAKAEAKAKEEQIQAAEKQAEAAAKEAEKQAEAEAKAAEKQAEAEAKAAEKQAKAEAKAAEKQENGNGNSAESDN